MKMLIGIDCRNDQKLRVIRWLAGALAAVLILSSGGCMVPVKETYDGSEPVTRGQAKRDLGIDYLSSQRTAMAIRELTTAIKLEPTDPKTHLWLGEAYRRKGRAEEAEVFLLDAIRFSAVDDDSETEQLARLTLSALLSQMGRYAESLEHCEALATDPTFPTPWRPLTNCGWALFKLGRIDEAREHYNEALDYFPRFGPALLNLGILQTEEGHSLAAIKSLERALDSGRLGMSGLGEAHYRLGEIYVGLGRRDKAVEQFKEATIKAPYVEWGTQSQAYLDLLR
jgi:Tfp pilus assembly protein PilF